MKGRKQRTHICIITPILLTIALLVYCCDRAVNIIGDADVGDSDITVTELNLDVHGDEALEAEPDADDDPGDEEEESDLPPACTIRVDIDSTAAIPDGLTWATAFKSVQDGIDAARGECEVWVAEGTYFVYETSREDTIRLLAGTRLYGGFEGNETETGQRDWEAHSTILDGHDGPEESAQVLHVMTAEDDVLIDGFMVTGGKADVDRDDDRGGGLLLDWVSGVTVSNCTFSRNEAVAGAAIAAYNCPVIVHKSRFIDNLAVHSGGAIHIKQPEGTPGTRTSISSCTFSNNSAEYDGGAIHIYYIYTYERQPLIENCVFTANTAGNWGGAICGGGQYGHIEVVNCTFYGNDAPEGGAYCVAFDGSVTIANSILWGNEPEQIKVNDYYPPEEVTVVWSDVQGGWSGEGNIRTDPLFDDPDTGDFHLQADSPCIDAADGSRAPGQDLEGNDRHDAEDVHDTGTGSPPYTDMGAYEYQG